MYERILVAYNASKNSAIALHDAAELARMTKGELHILGIVATIGALAAVESAGALDVLGMEHKRIQEALNTVAGELSDEGMNVHTAILEGDPADQIIEAAYRVRADLVVIGHTNKGGLARWFQGSVGAKLLSDLPCSLLIAAQR